MDAARTPLWTAGWSRKKRAAVFALGLLMFYLHSLYILGFYVSEDEYWWPVWTGMTLQQRLLSCVLALFANLGLLVMPFLRAPGSSIRAVLTVSLAFGLVISIAWHARDLWTFGLLDIGSISTTEHMGIFLADIILLGFTNPAQGALRHRDCFGVLVLVHSGAAPLRMQESRRMADAVGSAGQAVEDVAIDASGCATPLMARCVRRRTLDFRAGWWPSGCLPAPPHHRGDRPALWAGRRSAPRGDA